MSVLQYPQPQAVSSQLTAGGGWRGVEMGPFKHLLSSLIHNYPHTKAWWNKIILYSQKLSSCQNCYPPPNVCYPPIILPLSSHYLHYPPTKAWWNKIILYSQKLSSSQACYPLTKCLLSTIILPLSSLSSHYPRTKLPPYFDTTSRDRERQRDRDPREREELHVSAHPSTQFRVRARQGRARLGLRNLIFRQKLLHCQSLNSFANVSSLKVHTR